MTLTRALLIAIATPLCCASVTLGQMDTFQNGTTENWFIGPFTAPPAAAQPANVANGGPAGAGDRYLLLTSIGGTDAGSRLVALNSTQWAGDYLAAGITAISMDVNNFSDTDLYLRLLFENPTVGPPTDLAFSKNPVVVPAHSGWTPVLFPIASADLTAGFGSISDALSTATVLRIFHNPAPAFGGPGAGPPAIVAQLGVDNIVAVPEPSTVLLLGGGLLLLLSKRTARIRG